MKRTILTLLIATATAAGGFSAGQLVAQDNVKSLQAMVKKGNAALATANQTNQQLLNNGEQLVGVNQNLLDVNAACIDAASSLRDTNARLIALASR